MLDLGQLLPHSKRDAKLDTKSERGVINEVADMKVGAAPQPVLFHWHAGVNTPLSALLGCPLGSMVQEACWGGRSQRRRAVALLLRSLAAPLAASL